MEVEAREVAAGEVGELGHAADARVMPTLAAPHGQGRAPVAVAREGPVDVALEPVAEASVLQMVGMPADPLVLAEQRRSLV